MRSLTFTLDTQTGDDAMAPATLTITETADGSLSFQISNELDSDTMIGDLRALFFDLSDDALLGTLTVAGTAVTEFDQSGSVSNLGKGATASGVPNAPYEIGIEIGTAGAATDDIQTTSFTLSSSDRALTLDDIAMESFTVRQTSVGEIDGDRGASDKLYGDAPYPVNAIDDAIILSEDMIVSSNVFANDIDEDAGDADGNGIPDGLTVTNVNGEANLVGADVVLDEGIVASVDADGSIQVDAEDADYLSAGETLEYTLTYGVNDGNGGFDEATVSVTVTGVNDDPTANSDSGITDEQTVFSGNVLDNDSDVDRLDVISVTAVNGDDAAIGQTITLDSGALLTLNADGSYDYDPNGAFDELNDGETGVDTFGYTISDGQGGTANTTVEITIEGIGADGGGGPVVPEGDHFGEFFNKKGTAAHHISNVVFYVEEADGDILKIKVDGWSGVTDLDDVDIGAFLSDEFADAELLAVSIKAGNNHNTDLGPGEGQLFLLDGNEDIDYTAGGVVPNGMTIDILGSKADITYSYDYGLFA